jgi:hypothetical protein
MLIQPSARPRRASSALLIRGCRRAQDRGGSSPVKLDGPKPWIDGPKTIRQRSNLDDITDISWLDGEEKNYMRVYFTDKYGQAFDG